MGDRAQEDDEQEPRRQQPKEACNVNNDFRRYTVHLDDHDQGDYQQNANINDDLNLDGENTTTQTPYAEKIKVLGKVPDATYFNNVARLNEKQRLFLTHVMYHIRNNHDLTRRRFYDTAVAPV